MTSSSPEIPTRTTGARRAPREARDRAAARTPVQRPPDRYEPWLDGLFTYCLSALCDHEAATAALAGVLALADRRRGPDAADDRRAWLYALARWACLRKLAEDQQPRQGVSAPGRHGTEKQHARKPAPAVSEEVQERRQRELARIAWPEAAGTTPEQREALELAVRHQLATDEVAAVLGLAPAAARALLASAACEVERTRAALAVVETGACPSVALLAGDQQVLLSATLRRELVRHVDDCPRCRRTAERAAPGHWPGTSVTPAALPVLEAPREALRAAMDHLTRARGGGPRFDRRGFPVDPRGRATRRDRLRAGAVTTAFAVSVAAAPVLALWVAPWGAPPTGEGGDGPRATAREVQGQDAVGATDADGYQNAANTSTEPDTRYGKKSTRAGSTGEATAHLAVEVGNDGDTTLITLTASGRSPVHWSAHTNRAWLSCSQSSGILAPGASLTIRVHVDHLREPAGHWTAQVSIAPGGAGIPIEGYGTAPLPNDPRPTPPGPRPYPVPTTPGDRPPTADPTPTEPGSADPTPTPSGPGTPDSGASTPPTSGDPAPSGG